MPTQSSIISGNVSGKQWYRKQKSSLFDASTLARATNDLEPAAISLCPPVGRALAALARTQGCRLARMSGSGATCFGLYDTSRAAEAAARAIRAAERGWWLRASALG